MTEKHTLTIQLPALNAKDKEGRYWWPFNDHDRLTLGKPGYTCDGCGAVTWRGFKRGLPYTPDSMRYLCTGCVELVNPWEVAK